MFSVADFVIKQFHYTKKDPTIESWVFHGMKFAMTATMLACLLVTARDFLGDNINCVTGFTKNEHKAIETYCFISSTYSAVNTTDAMSPHSGIGPVKPGSDQTHNDEDVTLHAYYQWVPLVLVIQSALLYFPRWIWKGLMDKKKFKTVLGDLDAIMATSTDREKQITNSAKYMARSLKTHSRYAAQFFICELLCCGIAIGNLFFTNAFLGGNFFSYGGTALSYITSDATDMNNPLNIVFPKITKCTWRKFGPTGSIQSFDSMCVLPLNIVNEKTYIILWLVYIITLAVISVVMLLHILQLIVPGLRKFRVKRKIKGSKAKQVYSELHRELNYGAWFFVHHLSRSMVPTYFEEWIIKLKKEIDEPSEDEKK